MQAVFAALVAIFGEIILSKIDPIFANSIRSFVMFLFVFLVALSTKKFDLHILDKNALF